MALPQGQTLAVDLEAFVQVHLRLFHHELRKIRGPTNKLDNVGVPRARFENVNLITESAPEELCSVSFGGVFTRHISHMLLVQTLDDHRLAVSLHHGIPNLSLRSLSKQPFDLPAHKFRTSST